MGVDLYGSDPVFDSASKQVEDLDELIRWTRGQLGLGEDRPWRVVSSYLKLTKSLFEVEENGRRLIGKVSRSERAADTHNRMRILWNAGFRPPSKCRIPEPIAWLPERHLLLQERAAGRQLLEILKDNPEQASSEVLHAAEWLRALRSRSFPELPQAPSLAPVLERCRRDLTDTIPALAVRFTKVLDDLAELADPTDGPLVPSHCDFHPMNIFVTIDGVVTAIDLDTVAHNEPAFDVAWFLAQTAIMGHHVHGSFQTTAAARRAFFDAAPEDTGRVALHVRLAVMRSLHYDLCILKLKEVPHLEPFLEAAESGALF